MLKSEAKEQFDYLTEKHNIKHVFSFDDAWKWMEYTKYHVPMRNPVDFFPANYTKEEFENGIMKVQDKLQKNGLSEKEGLQRNPVTHTFTDGQYIREIFNPAGEIIVTAIHKIQHPFFLLRGEMTILTENGESRIKAPHYGITEVGTKRIIYAHTDCVFVTVHPNPSGTKDVSVIEKELIADNFEEIYNMNNEVK